MDFWRTVLVLVRRWYVVLPAIVLSMGAAAVVYTSIPPVYVSSAVLVLATPNTGGSVPLDSDEEPKVINPLLNFNAGLSTSASILIQALSTPEAAARFGVVPGGETMYRVSNGTTNPELLTQGPFIFVVGESPSAGAARDLVTRVIEEARVEFADAQRAVQAPASTYITMNEVVPPTTAQEKGGSRPRAAAATLGLSLLAGLCAAYSAESLSNARTDRRRREARLGSEHGGTPVSDPHPARPMVKTR